MKIFETPKDTLGFVLADGVKSLARSHKKLYSQKSKCFNSDKDFL